MKKKDIFIPDSSYDGSDTLHHGKWSEEAKQRYREARRAGRSVYEMFAGYYNGLKKKVNTGLNNVANRTIYKGARAKVIKKMKAVDSVRAKIINRRAAERQQSSRTGKLNNHARLTKELNASNAKFNKLKKQANKKQSTGKILSDFAKAGLKKVEKSVKKTAGKVGKAVDDAFYTKREREADRKRIAAAKKGVEKARKDNGKNQVNNALKTGSKMLSRIDKKGGLKKMLKDFQDGAKNSKKSSDKVKSSEKALSAASKAAKKKYDQSLNGKFDKFVSSSKKKLKKGINAALKTADDLYENKAERKARLQAEKDASKAAKNNRKSLLSKITGKSDSKAYDEAYKKSLKKNLKKNGDTTLSIDSIKKSATKAANKGLSKLEKNINKGLRALDDMHETSKEKSLRESAKAARKDAEKASKTKSRLTNVYSKDGVDALASGAKALLGKAIGNKKMAKDGEKANKRAMNRMAAKNEADAKKAGNKAAAQYEKEIYDKQIKLPRFGAKKSKRVKHVDSRSVYIPGKTGSSEEYLRHKF